MRTSPTRSDRLIHDTFTPALTLVPFFAQFPFVIAFDKDTYANVPLAKLLNPDGTPPHLYSSRASLRLLRGRIDFDLAALETQSCYQPGRAHLRASVSPW